MLVCAECYGEVSAEAMECPHCSADLAEVCEVCEQEFATGIENGVCDGCHADTQTEEKTHGSLGLTVVVGGSVTVGPVTVLVKKCQKGQVALRVIAPLDMKIRRHNVQ
jgi:hypothetical protein